RLAEVPDNERERRRSSEATANSCTVPGWRNSPAFPAIHILPEAIEEEGSAMGKVLVLYDWASGNTAKMAALVAEGAGSIPGIEVRLRKVDETTADDVLWCDGLALGSPTNMGLLSWKMKRFWDEPMAPHWMKVD